MQAPVDFADITAETPTLLSVTAEYQVIQTQLNQAQTSEQRKIVIEQWDALRRRLSTWRELTQLHFHQDTQNPEYKTALDYCSELSPSLTALEVDLKRQLIQSPDRAELEQSFGRQAFLLWEADITTFEKAIAANLVEESKLTNEYTELIALAKLEFQGEQVNLSGLQPYLQSKNRDIRHQAEQCRWQFFEQNQDRFDQLFDRLVKLRDRMAKKLGYENYIALGYRRMRRVDYDQTDVERYRDQVVQEVVPLAIKLIRQQAQRLNLDTVYFWDESVFDAEGSPAPIGDHDWMLERAQKMFDAMNPSLGGFFSMMVEQHLLDLQNRPGKAGGGFCTSFATYDMPYVFANFNGTKNDVQVFVHEIGHAFQMWRSRHLPVFDYLWPTLESCEIHSMSLEFLTRSQMEKFFGDQAERFRRQHLAWSILFLPYGVAVDHFQHLVYANPEATPQERHQMWQQMEARYLPWRQYGDLNYLNKGGLWQDKQHIYCSPFYYIDYTLAGCCALQFWIKAEEDYSQALADYIALCDRGGSASFRELVRSANLISPFEPGALTKVVEKVRQTLKVG
ncbi:MULTISPECIES: M3 family oligoendopeptidase [Nostoc]|uniref:M3 family oligoendopeptidase n=2 Tax=Nostoc TaxID=1177 RepID=A0ABR8IC80_9NOSO|nr:MULTISPECIES: M3 family oligoendopeptidase [Nostoc]MBD2564433.1 M3 family oligoendopeptidase [Nostoc linckia FACHB-391]MBD2649216.1 M3 family oligoendopeptidase [Nostoc foliaceum FACHB-393]